MNWNRATAAPAQSLRQGACLTATLILLAGLATAEVAAAGEHKPRESSSSSGSSASSRSGGSAGSSGSSSASSSGSSSSDSGSYAVPRTSSSSGHRPRGTTDRSRRGGSYHHGHYGYGHYYYSPYARWGWWGWYSPWWYAATYPYGVTIYSGREGGDLGAIDTDVWPEEAEVYVNGERVGRADDFDGWPGYLWLETGTYDIAFYRPGHRTLSMQVSLQRGQVVDIEDTLPAGDAVRPEDLVSKSTERRDARLRRNAEQRAAAERTGDEPEWQQRVRSERRGQAPIPPAEDEAMAEDEPLDARQEPARLSLQIAPAEAAVYLDGRFLGLAKDIYTKGGVVIDAGDHELEVLMPGYTAKKAKVSAKAGEEVELTLQLEPGS